MAYYGSEWFSSSSGDRALARILDTRDLGGAVLEIGRLSPVVTGSLGPGVLSPLAGFPEWFPSTVPPVVLPVSFKLSLSWGSLLLAETLIAQNCHQYFFPTFPHCFHVTIIFDNFF